VKDDCIGFLHPGNMGVSLAAAVIQNAYTACWVPEGRSRETLERAEKYGLTPLDSLEEMCNTCGCIISVCPPHAALDTAAEVAALSYQGNYADVNAISPDHALEIAALFDGSGADFIDGGIIGGPAWTKGGTWLYLSGNSADRVADYFADTSLLTDVIGREAGKASALKMCYAANTKGTLALLCAVNAAADRLGVLQELRTQWEREASDKAEKISDSIRTVTAKAWRFEGEMLEIAETLEKADIPGGFHRAAAIIYQRISAFKDALGTPPLKDVLNALQEKE
jgi:3-hydroxyisobutyrate dehydrogenase-like beta-hydroxyacid dehydrogenase